MRHRDFRLLFGGSVVGGFVMPMQFLSQIFWIQDHHPGRQVLYVGLIAASRGTAMLLFSFIGGAFADRFERRRVLLACESTALGLSVIIALLLLTSVTGLALLVFRDFTFMSTLLITHLATVLALFLTLPYGKFVHGFYRTAALLKFRAQSPEPRA